MSKTITKTILTKTPKIPKIKKGKGRGRGVNIKNNYQKVNLVVHTGEKEKFGKKGFVPPQHAMNHTTMYIPTPISNTIPSTTTIPTTTPLENAMTDLLKTISPKAQVPVPVQITHPTIPTEEKRKKIKMKVPLLISSNLKEKAVKNPIIQVLKGDEPKPPPQLKSSGSSNMNYFPPTGKPLHPYTDYRKQVIKEQKIANKKVENKALKIAEEYYKNKDIQGYHDNLLKKRFIDNLKKREITKSGISSKV
jgi:hypothetical protein